MNGYENSLLYSSFHQVTSQSICIVLLETEWFCSYNHYNFITFCKSLVPSRAKRSCKTHLALLVTFPTIFRLSHQANLAHEECLCLQQFYCTLQFDPSIFVITGFAVPPASVQLTCTLNQHQQVPKVPLTNVMNSSSWLALAPAAGGPGAAHAGNCGSSNQLNCLVPCCFRSRGLV